jgi:hypothetical protein
MIEPLGNLRPSMVISKKVLIVMMADLIGIE